MSLKKNYILNILIISSNLLFPILIYPYISRILMPEYIGKITFAQSISYYFISLSLLGVPIYGMRELSTHKKNIEKFKKTFTELFIISLLGSIIATIIFYIFINSFSSLQGIKNILYITSFQIVFSFINFDYIFIVIENHRRRAFRILILRLVSLFLIYFYIKSYADYKIYMYILILPELIMRGLDIFTIRTYLNFKEKIEIRYHLKSLIILFISSISVTIYLNLDSTMLGFIKGDVSVGLYTSASKMVKILIPLIVALETVIAPRLILAIKEKNKKIIFNNIDIFLDFNFFIGIQLIGILFILSEPLLILFCGREYMGSKIPMQIMLPLIFFIPIGSFMSGKILISHNLEKLALRINTIGMLINIILNYIFIPIYGVTGAAVGTTVTEVIICILKTKKVKNIYSDYLLFSKQRLRYLIIGIFLMGISLILKLKLNKINTLYEIVIITVFYLISYITILFLFQDEILLKNIIYLKKKLRGDKNSDKKSIKKNRIL